MKTVCIDYSWLIKPSLWLNPVVCPALPVLILSRLTSCPCGSTSVSCDIWKFVVLKWGRQFPGRTITSHKHTNSRFNRHYYVANSKPVWSVNNFTSLNILRECLHLTHTHLCWEWCNKPCKLVCIYWDQQNKAPMKSCFQ